MSPILGIYASQVSGKLWPASSYESIATVTVGGGGASDITFSSIPSTYTHLQIRAIGYASAAGANWYDAFMQFNGDTGSNYDYHALEGTGSSVFAGASINRSNMIVGYFGGTNVSAMVIDILDYTNVNKNKTVRALTGLNQNNANDRGILLVSNLWRNTSAINSIRIFPSSSTISQHTQFALYGIKGVA
jgi:hypothetical protein